MHVMNCSPAFPYHTAAMMPLVKAAVRILTAMSFYARCIGIPAILSSSSPGLLQPGNAVDDSQQWAFQVIGDIIKKAPTLQELPAFLQENLLGPLPVFPQVSLIAHALSWALAEWQS
jgi:hypothetical protein